MGINAGFTDRIERQVPERMARAETRRTTHDGRARRQASSRNNGEGMATALGWFSIGLGLAELVAPGPLARFIGADDDDRTRNVLRGCGVRELGAGVGILTRTHPTGWVWSRVAGDAMDLALLGTAMSSDRSDRGRIAAATAAVAGVALLDVMCGQQLASSPSGGRVHTTRTITIERSPDELYRFWHDFRNLPRFMRNLVSVDEVGAGQWHWKARGPLGTTVEWDAIVTEDVPDRLIAWRSVDGSDVYNCGTVRFVPAPGDRGTEIHVDMAYDPPGGPLGEMAAKMLHAAPGQEVQESLRALKQVLETGEILVSDATAAPGPPPHPARPSRHPEPEHATA